MQGDDITLDFKNNGAMTLDDISFGPPEEIEEKKPQQPVAPAAPEIEEEEEQQQQQQAPAPNKENKEEKKDGEELPKLTLDDLSFEGAAAEAEQNEDGSLKKPEVGEELRLAAIRAVINKKLERNNLEAEVDLNDLTEEQLVDFEEEVDSTIIDAKYSKVKSIDTRVETILNYIEAGGDPKKITSLFQEREALESIDISDKDGQTTLIKSYYKNVKGLSNEDAAKRIDKLDAAGLLEDEAKDIKVEYDAHNESKIAAETEKQNAEKERKAQIEAKKRIIFEKALKDNNVSVKTRNDLLNVAFNSGVLPNGETMKIMDYKILEMQSNPESFYKLSLFLADPEGYEKEILQNSKNKEVVSEMRRGFNIETKTKSGVEKAQSSSAPEKTKVKFNF